MAGLNKDTKPAVARSPDGRASAPRRRDFGNSAVPAEAYCRADDFESETLCVESGKPAASKKELYKNIFMLVTRMTTKSYLKGRRFSI